MNIHLSSKQLNSTAGDAFRFFKTAPVANLIDLTQGKPIIIIAPHSDDETLGCGGLIALCAKANINVTVVVMTDGVGSHPNSTKYGLEARRDLRELEVRTALDELGAHNANIIYFRKQDGYLKSDDEDSKRILSVMEQLIDKSGCGSVFVTWGADPHPDHLASYEIMVKLSYSYPELLFFAYPIWALTLRENKRILFSHEKAVRLEIRQVRNIKRKAIQCFKTQVSGLIDDDPEGFQLTDKHIELFCSDFEIFIEFCANQESRISCLSSVPTEHFEKLYEKSIDPWNYQSNSYEINRFDATIQALPQKHYKNACEIGCSIGVLTEKIGKICDTILGIDCSIKAIEKAKLYNKNNNNIKFEIMRVPEHIPVGSYDLIVLSEVLYFFSADDLLRVSQFVKNQIEENGTCVLVNFLGDTESPMGGHEAANKFCALVEPYFELINQEKHQGFRIDVMVRNSKAVS
jgi:LmbE family N-acetylglucosaminyl deacetylase